MYRRRARHLWQRRRQEIAAASRATEVAFFSARRAAYRNLATLSASCGCRRWSGAIGWGQSPDAAERRLLPGVWTL